MTNGDCPKGAVARLVVTTCLALCALAGGCHHAELRPPTEVVGGGPTLPRELCKYTLPEYVIEPPDILQIEVINPVPREYRVGAQDVLNVRVEGALPGEPINGPYPVDPDGTINLGTSYGAVPVVGMQITQAGDEIRKHLRKRLKQPSVTVSLAQARGIQQVRGQHVVSPDGMVRLGVYGSVKVVGLTVDEAGRAIQNHLSRTLRDPEVSVDIAGYNSKIYYVVYDGGGNGQSIVRLPVTGNDTVLDALAQAGGLTAVSSEHRIWVARPSPADSACDQILPVDWVGITSRGRTATNYQLMAGDRIFVQAQPLIASDTVLARVLSPVERMLGVSLLLGTSIQSFRDNQSR